MISLTKEQKLDAYTYVLRLYKNNYYSNQYDGICHYLEQWLHSHQIDQPRLFNTQYFPEFEAQAPAEHDPRDYWFKDREERIEALKAAIDLVNKS